MEKYDVVVIGAGAAGVSCARILADAGKKVVILEAQDYVGGRVKTDRTHGTVELGAEFIHGEHAITWELVKAANLATEEWSYKGLSDYRVYGEGGSIRADSRELMAAMYDAEKSIDDCKDPNLSLSAYIDAQDVPEEVRFFAKRHIGDVEGADPDDLSIASLSEEYARASNGERNFRILDGYDRIFDMLAGGLEVRLEHPVNEVTWEARSAVVSCANGTVFEASFVVLTASIGVLQKGDISFVPGLPASFVDAVGRIGYGDNAKCIFWLTGEVPDFRMVDTRGLYGHFWQQKKEGVTIVTGYSGGPRATKLTGMGSDAAIEAGIEDLASAVGESIRSQVMQARFSSWSDNPYILGSYSYPKLGMGTARTEIQEPIANTIFYCGEASHDAGHASTVHGAIEMGRLTANRILYG